MDPIPYFHQRARPTSISDYTSLASNYSFIVKGFEFYISSARIKRHPDIVKIGLQWMTYHLSTLAKVSIRTLSRSAS